MPYILSLDEGTTSARAVLYDARGVRTAMEACPIDSNYPHPGWVEQDGESIWRAQIDAARQLLEKTGLDAAEVAAIGITNQRETTIVWDRERGSRWLPRLSGSAAGPPASATELALVHYRPK